MSMGNVDTMMDEAIVSWETISSYKKRLNVIYEMISNLRESVTMSFTIMGVRFSDKPVEVSGGYGYRDILDKIGLMFSRYDLPTKGRCRVKVGLYIVPITDKVRSISEENFENDRLVLDLNCYLNLRVVLEDLSPHSEEDTFESFFELEHNGTFHFPVSFDDLDALNDY